MSDLPLLAWEDGALDRVTEISRIHITWDPKAGGFLDGDGTRPSANGATYAGKQLSVSSPIPAVQSGQITTGPGHVLEVTALPWSGLWPWEFVDEYDEFPEREPLAANSRSGFRVLCFRLPNGQMLFRESLWIARQVGFTLSKEGRPRWTTDPSESVGWIVHRNGRFMLANHHAPAGVIELDGIPIEPGEMTPLKNGQSLSLQGAEWNVQAVRKTGK
jgi:hypothetical protein